MESIAQSDRAAIVARGKRPVLLSSQGRVLQVGFGEPPKIRERRKRGKVLHFSPAAARRFIRKANRIDWSPLLQRSQVKLLTLTYPKCIAPTPRASKGHLHAFFEWLRRNYPAVSGLYVVELQENGSPHFHIVWMNQRVYRSDINAVRSEWERLLLWDYRERGHHVQVDFQYADSVRGVVGYLAGYLAKGSNLLRLDTGSYQHAEEEGFTWWGVHNASGIAWAELREAVVEYGKHVYAWRRAVRAWLRSRIRAGERGLMGWYKRLRRDAPVGWTLYTDSPDSWIACFAELASPG